MVAHHIQQDECACHVVVVILQGLGNTLAHCLQAGEMDNSLGLFCLEHLCHCLCIADFTYTLQSLRVGVVEIIHYNHAVTSLVQLDNGVAADVSSTTREKNLHICEI